MESSKIRVIGAVLRTYGGVEIKKMFIPYIIPQSKYRSEKEHVADIEAKRSQHEPDPIVSCTSLITEDYERI